ncbi:MAG TPA: YggT family protein [Pyrinomonadaceae bacterium]|jgi:YggT family protein|nr:YggT family protein [Pyrinomonadaceae bacterium]
MLTRVIYPYIFWVITGAFLIFLAALILRLIFNYSDPNPFGKIGRFSYHLKKRTDRFVYPAARFLANFRVDTRLAPILTALIAGVLTYFTLNIISETFSVIQALATARETGNIKAFVGIVLYGLLDVLILFIFIRFISSWFVFTRNTFLGFVMRVTNPIMLPFQKLIPTIGMFDLSAMVVLILIGFLQTIILRIFVYS